MRPELSLMALTVVASMTGCTEADSRKSADPRPVRTVTVVPKPIQNQLRAIGDIRPRHETDIAFRVSGKVVTRLVDVGATVKKGDVLARLDAQDFENKLKSAASDIAAAEAALIEARGSEARLRHLLASGHATRANYEVALKNLRSGEAKLDAAKAAVAMASDQLAYTSLRADFDGIVTAVNIEVGSIVNVGQTTMRVARPDDRDAVFAMPEAAFGKHQGRALPEVVVTLLSDPAVQAEGIVREISPVADSTTRTFQVRVTLKNPPEPMRFGASVAGRASELSPPVVVLPSASLFDRSGSPAVWIVNQASSVVTLRTIAIERYEADRIVVAQGLDKGEIVVTAGVNRLRENQIVKLTQRTEQ
jgi:RND family efflux transporter MFP subunit